MNMPGFTAEAALSKTSRAHQTITSASYDQPVLKAKAVIPSFRPWPPHPWWCILCPDCPGCERSPWF